MRISELVDLIERALIDRPEQTARELALALGGQIPKNSINSALYGHLTRFQSDDGTPPRWRVDTAAARQTGRVTDPLQKQTNGSSPALYRWQEEALTAWWTNGRVGIIQAVTGTGKTRLGVEAIREQLAMGGKAFVLVPSVELLDQWYEQLHRAFPGCKVGRWGNGHQDDANHCSVVVSTIQTACRYYMLPDGWSGLLVADECHRYAAETFKLALEENFGRRLGLSATYARADDKHLDYLEPYFGGPPVFSIGYARAIQEDVTAHFKLALVGVRFTPDEAATYAAADDLLREARRRLLGYGAPESPYGEFMLAVNEFAKGPRSPARTAAQRYLKAFNERRRTLAESKEKTRVLKGMVEAIKGAAGTLLFTMTTDSADSIAASLRQWGVRTNALHSGLRRADRRQLLRRFEQQQLAAIAAPMVLDEGVDVPEADLAVIVAASRSERQMIQRMGRVLRKKGDRRLARIAILYVLETLEDPARGAHEAFLDTVTAVADDCHDFRTPASQAFLSKYLNDMHPRGSRGGNDRG